MLMYPPLFVMLKSMFSALVLLKLKKEDSKFNSYDPSDSNLPFRKVFSSIDKLLFKSFKNLGLKFKLKEIF